MKPEAGRLQVRECMMKSLSSPPGPSGSDAPARFLNRKVSRLSMNPQPGEFWLADLGLAAKTRAVVIVSRQDPNPPRALSCTCRSPRRTGSARTKYLYPDFRSLTATL